MYRRKVHAALSCFFLLTPSILLVFAQHSVAADSAGDVDYSEYDAVLALDAAELAQLTDGWHGGVAIDNAVAEEDGDANIGADLRYQLADRELSSFVQIVDSDIYFAHLQYAQTWSVTNTTRWRGSVSAGYENDALRNTEFSADFEDRDSNAALAIAFEHDFESLRFGTQLQAGRRRVEREGEGLALGQPVALDVEKDFRSLAWNIAAQWQFDAVEQSIWLRATRITDMDVSACLDDICLALDRIEKNFTLYDVTFNQQWYLTEQIREGVSLLSQVSGYSASVDHLPANYQFSIGGMYSVRGYEEGIAGGDEMALWRNELRMPWHSSAVWLMQGMRQYAFLFYDWGMVWQHAVDAVINEATFELLPQTATRLSAAGIGIDLAVAGDVTLRLEYAVAQSAIDGLVDVGDSRVHASVDWRAF